MKKKECKKKIDINEFNEKVMEVLESIAQLESATTLAHATAIATQLKLMAIKESRNPERDGIVDIYTKVENELKCTTEEQYKTFRKIYYPE